MAIYQLTAIPVASKVPPGDGTVAAAMPFGLGSLVPKLIADLVLAHGFGATATPPHPYDHTAALYVGAP